LLFGFKQSDLANAIRTHSPFATAGRALLKVPRGQVVVLYRQSLQPSVRPISKSSVLLAGTPSSRTSFVRKEPPFHDPPSSVELNCCKEGEEKLLCAYTARPISKSIVPILKQMGIIEVLPFAVLQTPNMKAMYKISCDCGASGRISIAFVENRHLVRWRRPA
jgi:hypothetical protein